MSSQAEAYLAQISAARKTARRVFHFAALSWWSGWVVVAACLIAWLGFGVDLLESLEILLAIGVAGVLGGVGLYATSRNLEISASRLEIDIATKLGG